MLIYSSKFYSDNSDGSDTCVSWVRTQDAYLVLCAFWWPLSVCHHGSLPQRPLRVCWSLRIPPSQCCNTGNVLENVFRSKYTWLYIYIHAHIHIYIYMYISRYTWLYIYMWLYIHRHADLAKHQNGKTTGSFWHAVHVSGLGPSKLVGATVQAVGTRRRNTEYIGTHNHGVGVGGLENAPYTYGVCFGSCGLLYFEQSFHNLCTMENHGNHIACQPIWPCSWPWEWEPVQRRPLSLVLFKL